MLLDTSGFPGRLRSARENAGLTHDQLGRLASCTDRTVQHYEAGKREPTAAILLRLAVALNTTVEHLMLGRSTR